MSRYQNISNKGGELCKTCCERLIQVVLITFVGYTHLENRHQQFHQRGYSSCSIKDGHQIWSFFQHFWFILLQIPRLPLRLKFQSTHLSNPEHVFQIQRSSLLDPKVQNKTFKTKTKMSSLVETLAVSSRRPAQPIQLPKSSLSRVWLQTCTLPRVTSIEVFFLFTLLNLTASKANEAQTSSETNHGSCISS